MNVKGLFLALGIVWGSQWIAWLLDVDTSFPMSFAIGWLAADKFKVELKGNSKNESK